MLATGDLSPLAEQLVSAGLRAQLPAPGILQLFLPSRLPPKPRVLISAGVHGDETAPIEMLAAILDDLVSAPLRLAVNLMVVVGNPSAIAQGKRFIDADLNRLFGKRNLLPRESLEGRRADTLMQETAGFFLGTQAGNWHLDLHTAIRRSHYPRFAVVPAQVSGALRTNLLQWLQQAGIEAVILNPLPAGTYSAYTAAEFGAASATLELGQVGVLGENRLGNFQVTRHAIDMFIRSGRAEGKRAPLVFTVTQELIKHSEAFRMTFDRSVQNFTPMEPGALIAEDGNIVYRVGPRTEYVVFPNPDVRPGLRAGLMVVLSQT